MTTIIRNGNVTLEELRVTYKRRMYRVTGSPSLQKDQRPLVEGWVCETFTRTRNPRLPAGTVKFSDRHGHWRRMRPGLKRDQVVLHARRVAEIRAGKAA